VRSRIDNLLGPFIALTLIMGALAFLGFLQEVAYAFVFFGAYAIYRMVALARSQLLDAAPPLLVMGSASIIALLLPRRDSSPLRESSLLSRTETLHYYGHPQILRFFHEGIYGRYFEEGRLLGHGMNLHEGLQLVSSTTLSLIVCLGIVRPKTRFEGLALSICCSAFGNVTHTRSAFAHRS
jgi:hypothetical protein